MNTQPERIGDHEKKLMQPQTPPPEPVADPVEEAPSHPKPHFDMPDDLKTAPAKKTVAKGKAKK